MEKRGCCQPDAPDDPARRAFVVSAAATVASVAAVPVLPSPSAKAATMNADRGTGTKFLWPNDSPAALSFTYDDGYPEGATVTAPHLEEFGIRGTFYLTWEFIKNNTAAWNRVRNAGHELGNHLMTHPHEHLEKQFRTATEFMEKETGLMEHNMNLNFGQDDIEHIDI